MTDGLSVAASVIAVVQITGTVITYLEAVKDAPKERKRILEEVTSTHYLLFRIKDQYNIKDTGDGAPKWDEEMAETMRWLSCPNGPLEQFKRAMETLSAKLKPSHGLQKFGKSVIWPFKKEEIKDLLQTMERQKTLFTIALQMDNRCKCVNRRLILDLCQMRSRRILRVSLKESSR
jgi:hypothetical protein